MDKRRSRYARIVGPERVIAGVDCGFASAATDATVVEFIDTAVRPDLVVHTGDVVGVFPDDRADREAAVAALGSLRAPLLVLPGNHDVGEPGLSPWLGFAVSGERVAEHCRAFGEVPFLESFGEWGLLGLNSELLG